MKFSILMPTQLSQTRKSFILEAIESVREQVYQDWELIIKADENTADLGTLQGLELKNITIILNKDRGITDAVNQCLRFSAGDAFMWLNDDDKLLPHTLQTINDNIESHLWGFGKMITDRGMMGVDCNLNLMKQGNHVCQPTVFWTREAYKCLGELNCDQDLVSDYDYWVRLMKAFPHKFINEPIAWYRLHPDQITNKINTEQLRQAEIIRSRI